MKLGGRDAAAYLARPDPAAAGALLYGADAMRVALKRGDLVSRLVGPAAEAEMRLTRIAAADLRRDPAGLLDAVKATGFFPGPRVVLVEEAGDGLADVLSAALAEWTEGDAQIVVTAGALAARSKLRKLFEGHATARAIGIYDDPPGPREIEAELKTAGLDRVEPDARRAIDALGRSLDPGDFRLTLEKLALYKLDDETPVTPADVAACAPATFDTAADEVINLVAEGDASTVVRLLPRLFGQGVQAVTLCIGTLRHFRALHAAAANPGGPGAGVASLRPPVWGPRRDRMVRQARNWEVTRLEKAISMLVETDLSLRSASRAPQLALIERTLIRIAMMGKR